MSRLAYHFRCTIHNLEFACGDLPKGRDVALHVKCPLCQNEEIGNLRSKLADVEDHRDTLLKAIDIKLAIPVKEAA